MNKQQLMETIRRFTPWNEQEARDKKQILSCMETTPDIFERSNNMMHMTASAWVVNSTRDRVLMVYHNIYNSWSWLGGHADGEEDLLQVAIREVKEESGIHKVTAVSDEIYSLEILTVDGHMKRGEYVSSHLHYNITYLLEADEEEILTGKEDENRGAEWFALDDAIAASTEPWFQERIYSKLNEKLGQFV